MTKSKWLGWTMIVGLFLTVFALWVAAPFLTPKVISFFASDTLENQGELGDLFGSINALFSGLAFCGILITIYLQQRELRSQAEETKELKEIQKQTVETLEKTLYANSFAKVYDILDDKAVLSARKVVDQLPSNREWTADEMDCAKTLLRAYNIAGIMAKHNLLPEHYVVDDWSPSLLSTWRVLEPFVIAERIKRGDDNHWLNYQTLAKAAVKMSMNAPANQSPH